MFLLSLRNRLEAVPRTRAVTSCISKYHRRRTDYGRTMVTVTMTESVECKKGKKMLSTHRRGVSSHSSTAGSSVEPRKVCIVAETVYHNYTTLGKKFVLSIQLQDETIAAGRDRHRRSSLVRKFVSDPNSSLISCTVHTFHRR